MFTKFKEIRSKTSVCRLAEICAEISMLGSNPPVSSPSSCCGPLAAQLNELMTATVSSSLRLLLQYAAP